jgi:hypothetical protein
MTDRVVDDQCDKIFALLITRPSPLRFVELFNTLNGLGIKMSRPTLIQHLHHLQKDRAIIRKREGKQKVYYSVNWDKFKTLKQSIQYKKDLLHLLENEKRFKSFPIDEQAIYSTNIMTLTNLRQLQLFVENTIDPSKTFEHSLQFLMINKFYQQFQNWLIESCRESKENAQHVLQTLELNIKRLENELFEKIKQRSN